MSKGTAQVSEQAYGADDEFDESLDIAVIGMAGRFPSAGSVAEYWHNLKAGVHSLTRFTDEELEACGVDAATREDPGFVRAGYVLEESRAFDAAFFGYSPREAELMDPQHRVLLECAWAAMESSGHNPERYDGLIGIYAGAGNNTYQLRNIASQADAQALLASKQTLLGNRSDFLSSRVAYKLGLEGPSVNVQSACSTSLLAVAQACQALLSYQCDMALAGGVSVDDTRRDGYLYREDGILSPDGYCRTFDARAQGTVGGDGAGVVVLKRVKDAIDDKDHIHAVIKGFAVNNDGARRAGFTAPSAISQARAISTALTSADVTAQSIRYVEVHGTATLLGDPIEFAALMSAFDGVPAANCALGSVKTNIGHLDSAAGVAGLIKTVLAVEYGQIPPSLHFENANPRIRLAGSPFYVNTELRPWPSDDGPRRAGVSSFGLGGTNVHVIVEQAPPTAEAVPSDAEQLLMLSARTIDALDRATDRLADHIRDHPGQRLEDIAFTLTHGRKNFAFRRVLVAASVQDALENLDARDSGRLLTSTAPDLPDRATAFMFTGFGSQFPGMARELYEQEEAFRSALDQCAHHLRPLLGQDIRPLIFDDAANPKSRAGLRQLLRPQPSDHPIARPRLGHPAVFALEYALVKLWAAWGVEPAAMIGHSLGEYVAACVAGVFSLPDALRLVAERARLIEEFGEGAMLAVPLAEEAVRGYMNDEVWVAAVNGPRTCVLSGTGEAIERVARELAGRGVATRDLMTGHAFHSPLLDPLVKPYAALVGSVTLNAPSRPFVSNVTGTWITAEAATDPEYWARHLRHTVRFADGLAELWAVPDIALVELGPAPTLTPDALQHPAAASLQDRIVVSTLPSPLLGQSDRASMLNAVGRLWLTGRRIGFPAGERAGRRTALPTYPFERRTYWLERGRPSAGQMDAHRRGGSLPSWFYIPSWRRLGAARRDRSVDPAAQRWLIFLDEDGVGRHLADRLESLGATVITVAAGSEWGRPGERRYEAAPGRPEDLRKLAAALRDDGSVPDRVVHCWSVGGDAEWGSRSEDVRELLCRAFDSLVHWAQATEADLMTRAQRWDIVSTGVCSVVGDEPLYPPKAALQGLCKVLVQEYPSLDCVHLDLRADALGNVAVSAGHVLDELLASTGEQTRALRGQHRWAPAHLPSGLPDHGAPPVRQDGVYLITGGLGRIGLLVAHALAQRSRVRLVLLGRTGLPPRENWHDARHPAGTRAAIRAVLAMEELGSRVMPVSADVSDPRAMRAVKERVLREFGPINGVVHCAGTTGAPAHRSIAELGSLETSWHFGPKLYGAYVLDEILVGQRVDFAVICSSISAVLGGLGLAAYAAANAALDAFAYRYHSSDRPWMSVNWEAWLFSDEERSTSGAAVRELALTPDEGRQIFETLLQAAPLPQIAVSTGDLSRRQELWSRPVNAAPTAGRRHERPHLRNAFVAPHGRTESRIAEIWQDLLGMDKVGVHDNFFELGGSSLLGLQVVHWLRHELGVAVPLTIVYEGPTVHTLAALVDGIKGAQ
ncbi:SDR family oxidoreductase [Nonomuraea sp. NPDC046802]|uniref:type I polyketide synthase n=1 Tax=Nonomuraea sp. NPDC046802 TaxID=3154919 RepID=UPI0033CB4511